MFPLSMDALTMFYNVPDMCGCTNSSKSKHASCHNNVSYVYQYQNGRLKYSCGIFGHIDSIITSIQINDHVNIFKKLRGNQFVMTKKNVHCYLVYGYPNLFYGPFTLLQELKRQLHESATKYKLEYQNFMSEFDHSTYTRMIQLSNELRSSFIGDDRTGEDERIIKLQDVNLYLETYLNRKTELMVFYEICVDKFNKMEDEKQKELERKMVMSLVWCDRSKYTECTICISDVTKDNYSDGDNQGGHLDCGHAFHNSCIKPWACMQKNTCPTCRTSVDFKKFITV